jgi:L-fucose isomerase-like protein
MKNNCKLGIIIGHREIFPEKLAFEGRETILKVFKSLGIDFVVLSETTKYVSNLEESKQCLELFQQHRNSLDGIFISLPDFGDERSIADVLRPLELNVPIFVHAFPDLSEKMDISHRRDAFCGKFSLCNILNQYGLKYTLGEYFTSDPELDNFKSDIDYFLGVCRVVKSLRHTRIGLIGARVNPFRTVRFSEKILEAHGISVDTIDLSEILASVDKITEDDPGLAAVKSELSDYIGNHEAFPKHTELNIFKLFYVIKNWISEYGLEAISLQCWPALQESLKIFPCTFMSLLSNNLMPASCETDLMGAVSMLALQAASQAPSGLFDWNNNIDSDRDSLMLFHCSNCPVSLIKNPVFSANAMVSEKEKAFITIHGNIKKDMYTFCRVHTNDREGKIEAISGEGEMMETDIKSFGTIGKFKIQGLPKLLNKLCYHGFEHHVAITPGRYTKVLEEAFKKYLNWDCLPFNE